MCGIVGMVGLNGHNVKGTNELITMLQAQKYRGPDDSGIVAFQYDEKRLFSFYQDNLMDDGVYNGLIGFNRLSIQDLSFNGHQPMCSLDEQVVIAFNGEIYNAKELKNQLILKGYKFRGNTDTEVILNLYIEFGIEKCVGLLNGMFAISILDMRTKQIFLTRDRVGIKPLYYYKGNNKFMFSSEVKSFLYSKDFVSILNREALYEYFTFRSTQAVSLLENVNQVLPGSFITIDCNGTISEEFFFHLNHYNRANDMDLSFSETKKLLAGKLYHAVNKQLVGDVKIGCQLSGGIDSSIVSYMAKNKINDTVSIIFDNEEYSEQDYINYVGNRLGIAAHKFNLQEEWAIRNLENVIWHLETILTHPNAIGLYFLTKRSKDYVTVLLSGEGADELFGGYNQFQIGKLVDLYLKTNINHNKIDAKLFRGLQNEFAAFAVQIEALDNNYGNKVLKDFDNKKVIQKRTEAFSKFTGSNFDKQVKYEMTYYLPELLLRQDKMSMANSIENRVPLLDNEIINAAFEIPEKYLLHLSMEQFKSRKSIFDLYSGKHVLKHMSQDMYGKHFAYRKKMGFAIPIRSYLKNSSLIKKVKNEILPSMKQRNLYNIHEIEHQIRNIDYISDKEVDCLFRCLTLEIWMQLFIDKKLVNANKV